MKIPRLSIILAAGLILCACSKDDNGGSSKKPSETSFALGADISWTTMLESKGYKFYTQAGVQTECTALMKQCGMNSIRLRVWVNPSDRFSSKEDVLAMALRAKANGMRLMIDFHYSDWWADPGQQVIPAAWVDYDLTGLKKAVGNHTREVLTLLKDNNIDVEWVQVGNEVADGMLYHKGRDGSGKAIDVVDYGGNITKNPRGYIALHNAGYDAVKEVYPDAKVIVHVDNGHDLGHVKWVLEAHKTYGGKYDIIGLSLYPGQDWQTPLQNCLANISELSSMYGRKVMICETGMDYWYDNNAYDMLTAMISGARKISSCTGVFYWEPEAPQEEGYKMGAFKDGKPTHAMDAFAH